MSPWSQVTSYLHAFRKEYLVKTSSIILVGLGLWAQVSTAVAVNVTVAGTAGPWQFVNGGLNTGYQYDYAGDPFSAPTVVSTNSGLAFIAGDRLSISYVSGVVSVGPGTGWPYTDANGDTSANAANYLNMPSEHMNPALGPYYVGELCATFANSSGQIVGTPFAVGNGGSFVIPIGATQLQLGDNDAIYSDDTGAWSIAIGPESVPEPGTTALVLVGVVGLAVVRGKSGRGARFKG
jgi:hypothetical protein